MRITANILIEIARDYVKDYKSSNDDLIAAYLTGSVLSNNSLIGGTTDVDIVLIKDSETEIRETVKLSPNIHLDILSHPKKFYQPPKAVRVHPYLSFAINQCMPLMDDNHFINFTQAGVRSGFDSHKNRYERSLPLLKEARKLWLLIEMNSTMSLQKTISIYLDSITYLSQSIAILHNDPLTQRDFLPCLRNISEENSFSALHIGVMGLIGGNLIDVSTLKIWQLEWEKFFSTIGTQPNCPPQFHPAKITYYQSAINALQNSKSPMDGLWLLITTWVNAHDLFPKVSSNLLDYLKILGFSKETFSKKQIGLDALLDLSEEWFENWKNEFGI